MEEQLPILEDQPEGTPLALVLISMAVGAVIATGALVLGAWVALEKAWRSAQG